MEIPITYSLWGIYAIKFDDEGQLYVGATSSTFGARTDQHLTRLRNNNHPNKDLQQLFNAHGEAKLKVFILDININTKKELIRAEKRWSKTLLRKYSLVNKIIGGRLKFTSKRKPYTINKNLPIFLSNNPELLAKFR
jgi:hypothetical protein